MTTWPDLDRQERLDAFSEAIHPDVGRAEIFDALSGRLYFEHLAQSAVG